jgi:hypothetical protein
MTWATKTVRHMMLLHIWAVLHLADEERLQERLKRQGQVILAIDGMQPDVGHARALGHPRLLVR